MRKIYDKTVFGIIDSMVSDGFKMVGYTVDELNNEEFTITNFEGTELTFYYDSCFSLAYVSNVQNGISTLWMVVSELQENTCGNVKIYPADYRNKYVLDQTNIPYNFDTVLMSDNNKNNLVEYWVQSALSLFYIDNEGYAINLN